MTTVSKKIITVLLTTVLIASGVFVLSYDEAYAATSTKPAKAKISKVTTSGNTLTIKWKKTKRTKKYQLAYRVKGTKAWKYKKTKKRTFTIKNLKYGTNYQIKVRAFNGKKKGKWSTVRTKKTAQKSNTSDSSNSNYKTVAGVTFSMRHFNSVTVDFSDVGTIKSLLVVPVDSSGNDILDKDYQAQIGKDLTYKISSSTKLNPYDILTAYDASVVEPNIYAVKGSKHRLAHVETGYDGGFAYCNRVTVNPTGYTPGSVKVSAYYKGTLIGTKAITYTTSNPNGVNALVQSHLDILANVQKTWTTDMTYEQKMSSVSSYVHNNYAYSSFTCLPGATILKITSEYLLGEYGCYYKPPGHEIAGVRNYSYTGGPAGHVAFLNIDRHTYWEAQGH